MNVMTEEVPLFVEAEAEIIDDNFIPPPKLVSPGTLKENLDKYKDVLKPVAVRLVKLSQDDITQVNVKLKEAQMVIPETDVESDPGDMLSQAEGSGETLPIKGSGTQDTATSLFSPCEGVKYNARDQRKTCTVKPLMETAVVGMDKETKSMTLLDSTNAHNKSEASKEKRNLNESADLESVVSGDILGDDVSSDEEIPSSQESSYPSVAAPVMDTTDKLLMFVPTEDLESLRPDEESNHDSDLDDMLYKGQNGEDDLLALEWAGKLDDATSVNSKEEVSAKCGKDTEDRNPEICPKGYEVRNKNEDCDPLDVISDPGSPDPEELLPDKSDSEVDEDDLFDRTLMGPTLDDNEHSVVDVETENTIESPSTVGKSNTDMNEASQESSRKSSPNSQKTKRSRRTRWTHRKKSSSPKDKELTKDSPSPSPSNDVVLDEDTKANIPNDQNDAKEKDSDELDTKFIKEECKTKPEEVLDVDTEVFPLSQKSKVNGYSQEIETIFLISDDEDDDSVIQLTQKPIIIELSDSEEEISTATASESDPVLTDEDWQSIFEADIKIEDSPIKIKVERERNPSGYSDVAMDKTEKSEAKGILERRSSENTVNEVMEESISKPISDGKVDTDKNKKSILEQDLELSDSTSPSSKESRETSPSNLNEIPPLDKQLDISYEERQGLEADGVEEIPANNNEAQNMEEDTLVDGELGGEMYADDNDCQEEYSSDEDEVARMERIYFAMHGELPEQKKRAESKATEDIAKVIPDPSSADGVKKDDVQMATKDEEQSSLEVNEKVDTLIANSEATEDTTETRHVPRISSKAKKQHKTQDSGIIHVPSTSLPTRRVATRSSSIQQTSLPSSRLTMKDVQKERKKRHGKPASCVVVINRNETQIARARQEMIDRENARGKASIFLVILCELYPSNWTSFLKF